MTDLNKTYHQCPACGRPGLAVAAYSPQTNVLYAQIQNLCADYKVRADNIQSKPRDQYNKSGKVVFAEAVTKVRRLVPRSRWKPARPLWSWETKSVELFTSTGHRWRHTLQWRRWTAICAPRSK